MPCLEEQACQPSESISVVPREMAQATSINAVAGGVEVELAATILRAMRPSTVASSRTGAQFQRQSPLRKIWRFQS